MCYREKEYSSNHCPYIVKLETPNRKHKWSPVTIAYLRKLGELESVIAFRQLSQSLFPTLENQEEWKV